MKKNTYIGQAIINYDIKGNMLDAVFVPHLPMHVDQALADKISEVVKGTDDEKTLKHNADMVLASWFNQMTEIELADRNQYDIASTVVKCEKYANDMIKTCILDYNFILKTTNQA